jgi:hypothetical protein
MRGHEKLTWDSPGSSGRYFSQAMRGHSSCSWIAAIYAKTAQGKGTSAESPGYPAPLLRPWPLMCTPLPEGSAPIEPLADYSRAMNRYAFLMVV